MSKKFCTVRASLIPTRFLKGGGRAWNTKGTSDRRVTGIYKRKLWSDSVANGSTYTSSVSIGSRGDNSILPLYYLCCE